MSRFGDWITTASGTKFWPLDPRPEDVKIEDIAHALSNTCRFGGHCREFYSVAQHCCLMVKHASPRAQIVALLHDAAEAYIGDIVTGVKRQLRVCCRYAVGQEEFKEVESRLLCVIGEALKVPELGGGIESSWIEVDELDKRMLATEHRDIMRDGLEWSSTKGAEPFTDVIAPWGPGEGAKRIFLFTYNYLQERRSVQTKTKTPPAGAL